MITANFAPVIRVAAEDPQLLAERLEAAERQAQGWAIREGRCGILVTRHTPTAFTVELHEEVPYGTTRERDFT
ncbi:MULTISPECIES: hypothetical protein [Paenarthrobacter]|uniref:Uncharacterized protein n=1 Tax=Paenarthrobacter ureafaciens TaxID=37931 RepID=A0AAX3EHU3_PAEUR|nr:MULTISPECIES: hypothetical protein [Paenarthrobacter]AMB42141.1 hypothetical protein AUT26_19420 [Arthrobacter sp. ATCC 21022]NKR11326.1 hypothetical protein [Arthrobacter sp. M5]NKR16668.1 hypothetical protein [Arthrobacter sp. M6]OEH57838.1 hypothetical protein A5N17_02000 [Arthrobacter sp. D2]OEH65106.1 hypothetical protein A5N13_10415 [Arthrobacter sp. D4]BCW86222.1 hypothetical protein NicSoilE8_38950 [Arthrobacter sp. NicSoilE8]